MESNEEKLKKFIEKLAKLSSTEDDLISESEYEIQNVLLEIMMIVFLMVKLNRTPIQP